MNVLKKSYYEEIIPKLQQEEMIKNKMAVPGIKKVVINIGLGEAKEDSSMIEKVSAYLIALSGQKPVVTKAKKSIAGFKLVKGQPVGLMVTLRGEKMYNFLQKLFNIVFPKLRDFRGIGISGFDERGNFTLGLSEQLIFPEVDYKLVDKTRGLAITIVTSAGNKEIAKKLLEYLGMPFRKEING
ncbi:MAG: large subunit ribosomal protein L5 [Microgenomates group bacterium Gr01-1014_93]|nr:MAG: large subunit ribosomal protein L5 [Microgenomates group bacterium Gr01-1014_93]